MRKQILYTLSLTLLVSIPATAETETWTRKTSSMKQCLNQAEALGKKHLRESYTLKEARIYRDTQKEVAGYLTGKPEQHLQFYCRRKETGTQGTYFELMWFIDTERNKKNK